jgi:hypothetical protein
VIVPAPVFVPDEDNPAAIRNAVVEEDTLMRTTGVG